MLLLLLLTIATTACITNTHMVFSPVCFEFKLKTNRRKYNIVHVYLEFCGGLFLMFGGRWSS